VVRRLATGLALVGVLVSSARPQGVFKQLQALQASGELAQALNVASDCTDPLERAQARLFVLHHAGDLAGALSAGLMGLRVAPTDPWLLERTTTLALDLGATDLALELVPRFEAIAAGQSDAEAWTQKADDLRTRTQARAVQGEQVRSALLRARIIAALAGLVTLLCFAWACIPDRTLAARSS
jgi:hypothetical protein